METLETIQSRRSIRNYEGEEIPEDDLTTMIKASMYAPSAGDEQPWEFIVIDDSDILEKIARQHSNAHMVKDAPVAVLICADLSRVKHENFWPQDCAAATQNFLLAAHDLGFASCWVGIYPRENRVQDVSKIFQL
ncbi:MAG: nitroreductase family protein, partial [bacterium]